MAGLQSILNIQKGAIRFNDDLSSGRLIKSIIDAGDVTAFILDANAQEQLYEEGINSIGVDIMDYMPYRPLTIAIKEEKGQPTNRVTLRDEGDFQDSFFLEVSDSQFEIKASDSKTEKLIRKYGRAILGLTDENIRILTWDWIHPELLTKAKEALYGNE